MERSVDCSIGVLVLLAIRPVVADDQLAARDRKVDPNAKVVAVRLVAMRGLDRHVTSGKPRVQLVQLLGVLPYVTFDRFARR